MVVGSNSPDLPYAQKGERYVFRKQSSGLQSLGQFLAGFVGYPDLKVGGLFSKTTAAPYPTGNAAFKFRVVAFMRTSPP